MCYTSVSGQVLYVAFETTTVFLSVNRTTASTTDIRQTIIMTQTYFKINKTMVYTVSNERNKTLRYIRVNQLNFIKTKVSII